ncbi:hypothetical protein B0P06_002239 [Clostridium saccharoperbutylacetonicum]|uniref:Uncharacterized protein n=1 Tax=Clostridium saccharoperbutylacetonicum N1-4(HMT) TaxID=931276 RepID=M1MTH8_9CLOT|nr:hypothetical protein Cspa_c56980 [Clostridium saccharoperbutylacetonicum N1-4(HMT)]NRT59785.1 hypothetical protein [Clostridium saccharoperbutylacetonicum]NSB23097.1 hypothetical protein [Clostridium saccharoperbutylacetonicum]NSB42468.1 hypothetical protein [Clostridium saccharoperbutylacetonicum]
MKNPFFFKLTLLIQILLTIVIPAEATSSSLIINYKYGLPFRYLNIYSKENVDSQLINILFKGNNGINIDILYLIINIVLTYLFLYLINFIIQKLNFKSTK